MSQQLRPCPFCGTPDPYIFRNEDDDTWTVACTWCGGRTAERGTEDAAMQAWNRRWAQ